MFLTTLALLLGATLPAGGAAVVCFGSDHVGVEVAGDDHCEDGHGDGEPAARLDADAECVDVAAAAVTLDRPSPAADATPALLALPGLEVEPAQAAAGRWDSAALCRPPPHLAALPTFILRI